MEFRTGSADFSQPLSGSGPRTQQTTIVFGRSVNRAAAGITAYTVGFGNNDDHNVGLIDVSISTEINSNVVIVTSTLGLRDWSGDWDDAYYGNIQFAVVAELDTVAPRPDVTITGVEMNQAVQFYRASSYLQPAPPDNCIALNERKATAFRVYVDWDADAGLPLTSLTGSIVVQDTSGTSTTLQPINPGGAIAPRADSEINQAIADHTLNFVLPAPQCYGVKTLNVQVWDAAAPASKSGLYSRTVVFSPLNALEMYVVGVNYTANNLNLPAPTQAEFTSSGFNYLSQVYPQGDIYQSGYTTITFNEDVNYTITNSGGCGSGMDDLLDQLSDMRGGSDEVYIAVLPNLSQIQTPGSNIGGCGDTGGGTAIVFLDQPGDTPHEVGHALGRSHAPCNPGQCTPMPANVDSNYPQYGALPAGSIGAYGFSADLTAGTETVFSPASDFDFMAYRGPQWVSAYTYLALAGAGQPTLGGTSSGGVSAHPTTVVPVETLFVRFTVSRDRHVERATGFHFEALPASQKACHEFVVELLDSQHRTLICQALQCSCESCGGEYCWPKKFSARLPYPQGSRWLRVWEKDKNIYEEHIPDPPVVKIKPPTVTNTGLVLQWSATSPTGSTKDLWYLVQWFDAEDEVWRGVAPRSQATTITIPGRYFAAGNSQLRVLASSGIATGKAEANPPTVSDEAKPTITLAEQDHIDKKRALPPVLHALAVDSGGRHVQAKSASWRIGKLQIAHGRSVDLRQLPKGKSELHLCMDVPEHGLVLKSWTIQHDGRSFRVLRQSPAHWPPRLTSPDEPRKTRKRPGKRRPGVAAKKTSRTKTKSRTRK
jgi:hypothetical protein